MLATLAPRRARRRTAEAIVAVEILYDYLDGLTEASTGETPQDTRRLLSAFTDALDSARAGDGDYYRLHSRSEACYLPELVAATRRALAGLPATSTVAPVLRASAARGATAQLHIHAASQAGTRQMERWAKQHAAGTALEWREFLAGAAASVLTVHALIALASNRNASYEHATELDRIYLSICVLPTILDSLIDHETDTTAGSLGYLRYFEDRETLARALASVVESAVRRSRDAPDGAQHVLTIVGVLAYYASAPGADSELMRPVTARLSQLLRPLLAPALATMRAWRAAKRLRGHRAAATVTGIGGLR
jgi:hypothetical protein